MALINNIPPQAYTRDTLVKAIEWVSTQPASVRERANSADLLVSQYLNARRKVAAQMEAPVSGEAFKNDLKHLAEDLKLFEDPSAPPPQPIRSPSFSPMEDEETAVIHHMPINHHYVPPVQPQPTPPPHIAPPVQPQASAPKTWSMDARSLSAAREIQQRFNLSNEGEALRLLITLGMERARQMGL